VQTTAHTTCTHCKTCSLSPMRSLSTRHTGSHQWHALFWPGITCWAARAFGGHAPWQLELPQVLWARPGALWGRRWGATDLVPACHVRLAFL